MMTERILTIASHLGGTFTPEDVAIWPELYVFASNALEGRQGPHPLPHIYAARILNAELALHRRAIVPVDDCPTFDLTKVDVPVAAAARPAAKQIPNGYYTVEFADGTYRTLRVSAWDNQNKQVVSYLNGPDNTVNYKGFAEIVGGAYRIWNNFREDSVLARALHTLVGSEDRADMTAGYAHRSGRCARCNRLLTVVSSITNGYGPECLEKIGAAA